MKANDNREGFTIVVALLKRSRVNENLASEELEKFTKLNKKIDDVEKKIRDLYEKREELVWLADKTSMKVQGHSEQAAKYQDLARLEFAKDMSGPSEEKRDAWENFLSEIAKVP